MSELKTISNNSMAEITEKKSKFIAQVFYVESEEEINVILTNTRKKFFDARHNCYAYRIIKDNNIIQKCSDDGEPSGTAGKPMLTILEKNNYVNILIIVTRYFGGILLGTGGLVKVYSDATMKAIESAKCVNIDLGYIMNIDVNYQELEKIKYFCKINDIVILNEEFSEKIKIKIEISKNKLPILNEFCNQNINFSKISIISEKYIKFL